MAGVVGGCLEGVWLESWLGGLASVGRIVGKVCLRLGLGIGVAESLEEGWLERSWLLEGFGWLAG